MILTWGYDVVAMGGEHLDKAMLDKVPATQPILAWDASEHFVYANSVALNKDGITKEQNEATVNAVEGLMKAYRDEPLDAAQGLESVDAEGRRVG